MVEEADRPFPPPEETPSVNHVDDQTKDHQIETDEFDDDEGETKRPSGDKTREQLDEEKVVTDTQQKSKQKDSETPDDIEGKPSLEDQMTESTLPVSSSTGSDGETTGPSTAENSISQAVPPEDDINEPPKQVVGGRASIPDELEPHQLAQLQDLKESNA